MFTTFQAKGFPPTSAKCTENHWLLKDASDSLQEKRNKKATFHTLLQYLYSINKYEIKNWKKQLTFFFYFVQKKRYRYRSVFIFYCHLLFFLSTPPKRKWLLLYPDEESESKNTAPTNTMKALRVGGSALIIFS